MSREKSFFAIFAFLPSFVLPGVKMPCPIHSRFLPLSGAARFQQGKSNFTTISSVFQENFTSFCGKIITNLIK